MAYPVTLGHEFSGVIVEAGKDVVSFAVGDRVVSETAAGIDTSGEWYRTGAYNLDPHRLGFAARANGGMAEHVEVPERCLHRLPDAVSFRQGALIEPICVAYQATCVQTEIRPGDTVVVVGAKPSACSAHGWRHAQVPTLSLWWGCRTMRVEVKTIQAIGAINRHVRRGGRTAPGAPRPERS